MHGGGFRCIGGMTQRIMPASFAMGPAPSIAQRELNFSAPYAAALQAAQSCGNPILIRIETKAGHGAGKPTSKRIEQAADELGFLVRSLGMEL